MLYATDTLLPILFYFLTIPFTILSIALKKKGPLWSIKREQQTLPLIHKHSSQVTTLSPFTAKAALAV